MGCFFAPILVEMLDKLGLVFLAPMNHRVVLVLDMNGLVDLLLELNNLVDLLVN